MKYLEPEALILSNKFDFASDYIAAELKKREIPYIRLNQEDLPKIEINLFPAEPKLVGNFKNLKFEIKNKTLKSIFFRRPVFLRDNYNPNLTPNEQLSRTQWAAFNRALTVFTKCKWVNHPRSTYVAENKPFQLYIAQSIGFKIPKSLVTNTDAQISTYFLSQKKLVIKSLDSALLKIDDKEAFVYTNLLSMSEVNRETLAISPAIFQTYLSNKVDIRVTVVKDKVFSVYIKCNGKGINGDWRLMKDKAEYIPVDLPHYINDMCIKLVKNLKLYFGAIDLAEVEGEYYFLEINPTGEWAWLVNKLNLPIDIAITDLLVR